MVSTSTPGSPATTGKIATVGAAFWLMKPCATTLGETAGDLLSMTMNVGYATSSLILLGGFALTFLAQLLARRYHPALFWTVILTTSTAGTTMSDFMDRTLALGYAAGSGLLLLGLAVVLVAWRLTEGNLSVSQVRTRRAEVFYWIAILFSNTLGTALGDFLADDAGLGFAAVAALLAAVLLVLFALQRFTRRSRVVLFWAAFVLTRPFGATFGDLLTKQDDAGGLALGTAGSSAILATILVALVVHAHGRARPSPTAS
jgi:uncharacterized membrane-anchored protein